jgi:hypothetical protein
MGAAGAGGGLKPCCETCIRTQSAGRDYDPSGIAQRARAYLPALQRQVDVASSSARKSVGCNLPGGTARLREHVKVVFSVDKALCGRFGQVRG